MMKDERVIQMHSHKGFIVALDQSGGSTPKALRLYGVDASQYHSDEEMFNCIHAMRTRIMTSPAFTNAHILAAILFENTMDRQIEGKYTADYLWEEKHILPILKVDKGLQTESDGVQLMKPIPNLEELLQRAKQRHIFGTKMRSVIHHANADGIQRIVEQQFALGKQIAAHGFIPILEPEVDIYSEDKAACEKRLKEEIKKQLLTLDNEQIMFKLTLPSQDDFYKDLLTDTHIVRIVALSGGYSREQANALLAKNHGIIASFSRALTQGLQITQTQEAFDALLKASIVSIYEASIT